MVANSNYNFLTITWSIDNIQQFICPGTIHLYFVLIENYSMFTLMKKYLCSHLYTFKISVRDYEEKTIQI